MGSENETVFVRDSSSDENDVWDDTALIEAYDRAISIAKNEVALRMVRTEPPQEDDNDTEGDKSSSSDEDHPFWIVGSPCRAIYSHDDRIYEATISKIDEEAGRCLVTFIGYGNTEIIPMTDLLKSNGLGQQIHQLVNCQEPEVIEEYEKWKKAEGNESKDDCMECENVSPEKPKEVPKPKSRAFENIPLVPPIPPQLMSKLPRDDSDALSSMLMSWYVSGFHTGYYQAIKQAEKQNEK